MFYTSNNEIVDDPINKSWIELHYYSEEELEKWWFALAKKIIERYEQHGVPPRAGLSEDEIYKQIVSLCSLDVSKQIDRDQTDGSYVVLNTLRYPAINQFFPNIYEAKDKVGNNWLSVMDMFRNPQDELEIIKRHVQRDGKYMFSKSVKSALSLTHYVEQNLDNADFWFYKPISINKTLHGCVRGRVQEIKELIKSKKLPNRVLTDIKDFADTDTLYLREVKKNQKFLPSGFRLFESGKISAPTNFPAAVARLIYQNAAIPAKENTETIVWDPSMGFGGRLFGALSLIDKPIHYIGTDPNSLNYFEDGSRYRNVERVFKNTVRERRNTFKGTYIKCGSEEVHLREDFQEFKGKVDLVFTSPPYFSAELYNEEETQSSLKFDDYDSWRKLFLTRTLQTAAEWLRIDGMLVINIANSGGFPLEEDTKLICRELGLKPTGVLKMILAKSPGMTKRDGRLNAWNFARIKGNQKKFEPCFIYQKIKEVTPIPKFKYSRLYAVK